MTVKFNREIKVPKSFPKYSDKKDFVVKKEGTYKNVSSKYKTRFEEFNKRFPNAIEDVEEVKEDVEEVKEDVEVKE